MNSLYLTRVSSIEKSAIFLYIGIIVIYMNEASFIIAEEIDHFCEDDTSSAEMLFSLRNKSAMRQCYLNPRWKYDKREKQSFKICKPDMMSEEPSMHRDTS